MEKIGEDIINFLEKQGFVIVSTLDYQGRIHCSAKGIVGVDKEGRIYLIDLYRRNTFSNLKRNPTISITAVNEHEFTGFTLKGKAKIIERKKIEDRLIKNWEERVIQRVSRRVINNVQKERKNSYHPEALFPPPQYLIEVEVEEIINLTPARLERK